MERYIQPIHLAAQPAALDDCFNLLREVDPEAPFTVFGGAVRDAHYAAYQDLPPQVNDYDIRVWLPPDQHEARTDKFVERLGQVSGSEIDLKPSAGTGRIRYYLEFSGVELDISIRAQPATPLEVASVAIERAGDADAGLSSVAIAPDGTAWAPLEFQRDVKEGTISMYPRPDSGDRLPAYAERMQRKFPNHTVVWL